MTTISDIAREAGVSRATVSNVLNNKDCVKDITRERVLKIMRDNNYLPNAMARNLKKSHTTMIGVITEDITSFITPQIVDGINAWCEKHNIFMLVQNIRVYKKYEYNLKHYIDSKEMIQRVADLLMAHQVNAILYIGDQYRDISDILPKVSIPLICVQCYMDGIPSIAIDNEDAAYQMTKYLIERGHKRIGLITGILDAGELRMRGVMKSMREMNLHLDERFVFNGNWSFDAGVSAGKQLAVMENPPTAVFAFCDSSAAGLIAELREKNPALLRHLSIAGFDDYIGGYLTPRLTTVAAPFHQIGYCAAQAAGDLTEGRSIEQRMVLPCRIVERESVYDARI